MAAANELETFLASEAQAAGAEPTPPPPSEAPPAAPAPDPAPKAPAESKAATATPEDDDAEPSERLDHDGKSYIPQQVLERERRRRQDWKEKAARLEGQIAEMQRQQHEAQQAASQPQPMPPLAPIDPAQDPAGYTLRLQQVLLNERLNNSEMMLREKLGPERVDEYVAEFKQLAQRDQTLFGKLYQQTHPYSWMQREVERQRVLRDVGDDPSAFRAKIEAEARAKWEAEAAAKPAPVSPAAGLQPSLATARSVAGRTATTWTGEPSLEDVLAPVQNRKKPNGAGSVRF